MDNKLILQKVEELAGPVLENLGYAIVDTELLTDGGRAVLRIYIDKEGGISVDDCKRVSRAIGDIIDVEELIKSRYSLEISSPGIARPLRKPQDFVRFSGVVIKLKTLSPIDGRSNYKGILEGMDGDDILMRVDDVDYRIPISKLAKARIEPDDVSIKSKIVN
jgi:ribosome maturation factor RimP